MRRLLPLLVVPLMAAAPQRGLSLQVPSNPLTASPPALPTAPPAPPTFQPAPLPNRDLELSPVPKASNEPSLRPSLFTRTDTYRGEGFSKGSTATTEQERRVKPGVGFNLKMPLQPN